MSDTAEWQRRAYSQLMYAFMLRGTVDWYTWGMGWHVIESAPAEVVPPLPCEPNWRALPAWVRWWAIDGDGTIRGFHLKPMGWVEKRLWMLGASGPPQPGVTAVQLVAGVLGTPAEPQAVPEWWMTLRRRPEHLTPVEVEPEPVSKTKRKAKREKPSNANKTV